MPYMMAHASRRSLLAFSVLGVIGSVYSVWLGFLLSSLVYVLLGGYRKLKLIAKTAPRDISAAVKFAKANWEISRHVSNNSTVAEIFKGVAARFPDKIMFITKERTWTFRQVDEFTNKIATCFQKQGLKAGDDVAIYMESRPEYVMMWLGLSKIGVVSALINNNLKSDPLVHCITVINTKAIIFSNDLAKNIIDAAPRINERVKAGYYCFGGTPDELGDFRADMLQPLLESSQNRQPSYRGSIHDKLIYIYTSGTTGLPKAAIIKHTRYIWVATGVHHMMPITDKDVLYVCLPLYHMAACILGSSQCVLFGTTAVVVPKFSASRYWQDCITYKCTAAQYIGEICRYLLAQPGRKEDRMHNVRCMFGNGLRAQIWEEFRDRFGIPDIREVYGSTEGNSNIMNTDNTVGAVGFLPSIGKLFPGLAERIHPIKLIKVDESTGVPIRDRHGLCIPCKAGETGEMVGLVSSSSLHKFDGYVDKGATNKKLYRDVFHKGDIAFSSGDLLMQDELGYLFFKDRTGDTFRWKGENVSTSEVEGIITKIVGLSDCVVFGVEIPGSEGKAGMAAILDPDHKVDLVKFLKEAQAILPSYALPMFVRSLTEVDATGTYKLKKTELLKETYDISMTTDPVFFLDLAQKKYVPLDKELYEKIMHRQVRV